MKVIDLEGSATAKENLQQADLVFSLLEGKPVSIYTVARDFQYFEFTTGYKGIFLDTGCPASAFPGPISIS